MLFLHCCVLCFLALFTIPWLGKKAADMLFPAGSGLSDFWCELGQTQVYVTVTSKPASNNSSGLVDRAYAFLEMKGDAGNLVTSQCVCESALCLLFNRDELPARSLDGFGTPAELLGKVLQRRLTESKVRPVKLTTLVRTGTPKYEMRIFKD